MSEWIKCSDRLPEKGRYIVCADTDDGPEVCEMAWNGRAWIYEGEPTYAHGFYIEATHWQHLPPPPQD